MDFEIEMVRTYENYIKLSKFLYRKREGFVYIISALYFVLGLLSRSYFVALFIPLFFVIFWNLLKKWAVKKRYESFTLLKAVCFHYHFTENQIKAYSDISTLDIKYESIYCLLESNNYFCVFLSYFEGFLLNKSDCSPEQQEYIRTKCSYNGYKRVHFFTRL